MNYKLKLKDKTIKSYKIGVNFHELGLSKTFSCMMAEAHTHKK